MGGLFQSAVILVVVPIGVGETLYRSPRNAESFCRIKRRGFPLVPPYGGLLVIIMTGMSVHTSHFGAYCSLTVAIVDAIIVRVRGREGGKSPDARKRNRTKLLLSIELSENY